MQDRIDALRHELKKATWRKGYYAKHGQEGKVQMAEALQKSLKAQIKSVKASQQPVKRTRQRKPLMVTVKPENSLAIAQLTVALLILATVLAKF